MDGPMVLSYFKLLNKTFFKEKLKAEYLGRKLRLLKPMTFGWPLFSNQHAIQKKYLCNTNHDSALRISLLRWTYVLILKSLMQSMRSIQVNLCQKFFFLQNMGRTCCVQKLFWMSKTIFVHNMFSWAKNFHVLNL